MREIMIFMMSLVCLAVNAEEQHIEDKDLGNSSGRYDGIDVSSYQKDIDWEKVSRDRNVKFVYVKATEGATYTSPHFEANIKNAHKSGIKVGSYHFLRTSSSLKSQFDNFVKSARPGEQDLVPLIDIEKKGDWTRKQLCDSLQAFADMLRDHYGCEPMIYTSANFYNSYLSPFFTNYPLFIAKYSDTEPELVTGTPYTLWQYSDNGFVNGIDHRVDLCKFNRGKSVKNILLKNRMHDRGIEVNMVDPDMSVRMQTPSKFKSRFDKKAQKEKEKEEKAAKKKKEKEEKKQKDKKKKVDETEDDSEVKYSTKRKANVADEKKK